MVKKIILTQYMVNDSTCCLGNEPVNTLNRTVQASLNLEHPSALDGVVPLVAKNVWKRLQKYAKIFFNLAMVQL